MFLNFLAAVAFSIGTYVSGEFEIISDFGIGDQVITRMHLDFEVTPRYLDVSGSLISLRDEHTLLNGKCLLNANGGAQCELLFQGYAIDLALNNLLGGEGDIYDVDTGDYLFTFLFSVVAVTEQ